MRLAIDGILQQNGAAAPQLQYSTINMFGGTVLVKRNGSTIATLTTDTATTTVTLTAGDTIQMTFSIGSTLVTSFIYYYLNGGLTNTYSGTTTITGGVVTSAAGNTYLLSYDGGAI